MDDVIHVRLHLYTNVLVSCKDAGKLVAKLNLKL